MNIVQTTETIYYLEMLQPGDLVAKQKADSPLDVRQSLLPAPELSRFFYTTVGGDWRWVDRLKWTYAQWQTWVTRPGYELWIAYVSGTPVGYFELDGDAGGAVELAFFGLLPQFTNRGWGGILLTQAVQKAWAKPAKRVWLHTCSFDHPRAIPNYQARGFRLYRTETTPKEMPATPLGPWPGADKSNGERAQPFAE
jgi:GNAT superfamily N-acetyltransferase